MRPILHLQSKRRKNALEKPEYWETNCNEIRDRNCFLVFTGNFAGIVENVEVIYGNILNAEFAQKEVDHRTGLQNSMNCSPM